MSRYATGVKMTVETNDDDDWDTDADFVVCSLTVYLYPLSKFAVLILVSERC